MKKIIVTSVVLLILIAVSIYFNNTKLETFTQNYYYLDTYVNIKVYSKKDSTAILKTSDDIFKKYHELTDRYNEYGDLVNIYAINNAPINTKIVVDEDLYEMLELSKEYYSKSNGKFNIAIGSVVDVWKNAFDTEVLPTDSELDVNTNLDDLVLLGDNIIMKKSNIVLDLGAIAKGYIVDKVKEHLLSNNLDTFIINAGGNVYAANHYDNDKYKIGIESPYDKSIINVVNVENKAVVTSGGYERYGVIDGKKYHHIIDPTTKYPANLYDSVTVIATDSTTADILSTLLFTVSIEEAKEIISNMEVEAIWYKDNEAIKTDGFSNYE